MSGNSAPVPSLTLTTFETMVDGTSSHQRRGPDSARRRQLNPSQISLILSRLANRESDAHRRRTTHSTNQTFPSPAWQVADHNYASPCVPRPRSACDFRCGPHAREEAAYEPRARKTRHAGARARACAWLELGKKALARSDRHGVRPCSRSRLAAFVVKASVRDCVTAYRGHDPLLRPRPRPSRQFSHQPTKPHRDRDSDVSATGQSRKIEGKSHRFPSPSRGGRTGWSLVRPWRRLEAASSSSSSSSSPLRQWSRRAPAATAASAQSFKFPCASASPLPPACLGAHCAARCFISLSLRGWLPPQASGSGGLASDELGVVWRWCLAWLVGLLVSGSGIEAISLFELHCGGGGAGMVAGSVLESAAAWVDKILERNLGAVAFCL